ncbi:MAG: Na+-driven multidrug efflux pump [Chlorobi bacterium]|nr:Na+-driven multidrug efflux pump [Chlorobiota bacterium]
MKEEPTGGFDIEKIIPDDREAPATVAGNRARAAHPVHSADGISLTDGPIARTLWKLAMPLALGFVINAVYSWTNMYFVSRLGDDALAALGFSDQINFVIFTIGSGFCIGTGIVIARRVGQHRMREASVIATQAFSFMALYSTLAAIILYFVLPLALPLLGLKGAVLQYTTVYMSTLMIGFPANLILFQANSSVRSTGNTIFPMTVLIITAVLNLILDPFLILGKFGGPRLGVQGAAISTSIAEWAGALIAIYALYAGRLNLRLYRPTIRFDRGIIAGIFAIGVPSSMQTLAVSMTRVVIISIINIFGTAATAAYTIGMRVDVLVFMPIFATGIALETLTSQNIGAGRLERVAQFRRTAILHLGTGTALAGVAIFLFARPLAETFTADPGVAELTVRYLHIAVFGYLFFIVGQTATRSLSGAGHAARSMWIVAAMLLVVQIPLAYGLSRFTELRETGVFAAIAISYLVFAVIGSAAVRGRDWMMKNV